MSNDNKTLADVQPGGRVRLGDRPKDGEVLVEVSGLTGSGKSAIAGEIEILCKALGLEVEWVNGDEEKRLTHADWIGALEMYKPKVVIVERNIPRAALSAPPSPAGQGDAVTLAAEAIDDLHEEMTGARIGDEVSRQFAEVALRAARQPVGVPVMYQVRPRNFNDGEGWRKVTKREYDDRGPFPGYDETEWERRTLYAAPPAQAVDHRAALLAEERAHGETIDQRDRYHEVADELAGHIAAITGVDIGEHSSANCPWQNAIEAAEAYQPAQAVDLGAVREALQAAEGLATVCASVDGYSREEVAASGRAMKQQFSDALAKIDSKAVGE